MMPDPGTTALGMEYFCSEGDELWTMADADLIELGKRELVPIVTGGMGGLGESISTKMADAGYKVVVTYSPSNTKYKSWLDEMKGKQAVLTTPLIAALGKKFPSSRLVVLCTPEVREVILTGGDPLALSLNAPTAVAAATTWE